MGVILEVKNYRCFARPTQVELGHAFVAFIGLNNAGKSTIMRFLFECRDILKNIAADSEIFRQSLVAPQEFTPNGLIDSDEIFSNLNSNGFEFSVLFSGDPRATSHALKRVTVSVSRTLKWQTTVETAAGVLDVNPARQLNWNGSILTTVDGQVLADFTALFEQAKALANSVYIGPFRNALDMESRDKYLDIDAGAKFIDLIGILRTGGLKAHSESFSALVDDIRRIFDFKTFTFEASQNPKCLHFMVNDRAYKQHELGSGLLQFVLVLGNVLAKKPAYILIDEPELGLHPKLQLDFLTTLARFSTESIWFSTHNIGLARSVATQIYAVSSQTPGNSVLRPFNNHPSLAQLLGELSYSTHNQLGFDKILMVEGSSDLVSFQQILRKMNKDHRILLLSLNGRIAGNMELELQEVRRISTNIAAVIDSERSSSTDPLSTARADFQTLCASFGIQLHVLDRRATENYFSDPAIKAVLGSSYSALGEFGHLKQASPNWSKDQNWKLANAMSLDDWKANDLGQFLDELLPNS
ncbi:MAG: AAA family ATPase [Alphaproteobacteria bacterium]